MKKLIKQIDNIIVTTTKIHKIFMTSYYKDTYCGLMVTTNIKASHKWKYVTCKNCLRHKK